MLEHDYDQSTYTAKKYVGHELAVARPDHRTATTEMAILRCHQNRKSCSATHGHVHLAALREALATLLSTTSSNDRNYSHIFYHQTVTT